MAACCRPLRARSRIALRTVVIAARAHEPLKLSIQIIVDGDGHALPRGATLSRLGCRGTLSEGHPDRVPSGGRAWRLSIVGNGCCHAGRRTAGHRLSRRLYDSPGGNPSQSPARCVLRVSPVSGSCCHAGASRSGRERSGDGTRGPESRSATLAAARKAWPKLPGTENRTKPKATIAGRISNLCLPARNRNKSRWAPTRRGFPRPPKSKERRNEHNCHIPHTLTKYNFYIPAHYWLRWW